MRTEAPHLKRFEASLVLIVYFWQWKCYPKPNPYTSLNNKKANDTQGQDYGAVLSSSAIETPTESGLNNIEGIFLTSHPRCFTSILILRRVD
jgi:hypothetical protein